MLRFSTLHRLQQSCHFAHTMANISDMTFLGQDGIGEAEVSWRELRQEAVGGAWHNADDIQMNQ